MPYLLEEYHHRVFGAVASLKAQFLRPEWRRMQHIDAYMRLPAAKREEAMAAALGAQPAADVQRPRAADSEALAQADALRWLDYRTGRLGGDEATACRELLSFWAIELHKSLDSFDFPEAWKRTRADKLLKEIRSVCETMIRFDREKRDYADASFANAMTMLNLAYDLHEAMDEQLLKAVGGAKRPVLTEK